MSSLLKYFDKLSQKFHIHKSHFRRYLQLRGFVASNSDCFPLCPLVSMLDTRQIISRICALLNTHNQTNLDSLKMKWETDLAEIIPEATLQINYTENWLIFIVQFKIVHRLHWTKDRLSKIKTDFDPTCVLAIHFWDVL